MSAAQLQTALDNLDTEIVTLSLKAADARSYTIEGLTVARQRLQELIAARKSLAAAIVGDGANIFEEHSRWVP